MMDRHAGCLKLLTIILPKLMLPWVFFSSFVQSYPNKIEKVVRDIRRRGFINIKGHVEVREYSVQQKEDIPSFRHSSPATPYSPKM
jgi:hypothetical protein